jgi:hypothetical protein
VKKFLLYLKNSDISFCLALNPCGWRIDCSITTETGMDPGLILHFTLTLGPINITVYIDDGSW